MDYFLLYKTDKLIKVNDPINLCGGFRFTKKTIITLYNKDIIGYILTKKINKHLREIITLYLQYVNRDEDDSTDTDTQAILEAKVELLKKVLFENYAPFLSKKVIEDYITKVEKLEEKIGNISCKKRVM